MSGDSPTRTPTPRPQRSPGRADRAEAAAALRAEQRRRWRAGDQVPLESLLAHRPDLAADPALLIDLVYSEFVLAREVGAPASPAAYADRFPTIAAELSEQLELECALAPAAGTTVTGSARPMPAAGPFPRLPGYEIDGELGRGGMGVVYQARQLRLNRVVAVKTLPDRGDPDAADAVRFLAEAELVAAVKHPHVVSVFEFGHADGRPYFAMEYLPGGSLRDRLKVGGAMAAREAAVLIAQVARGVQAAHDQQVVHRDLKPANVLFDADNHPKVTDFGLARRGAGLGLTATQVVLGTPAYMAPEQAEGKGKFLGPAADVWALGAILYECLTGSVPFPGDDPMTVLRQVMQDDPASLRSRNPSVPRDLELVCLKCLRKNPADRYTTAGALADDLDRFAAGRPVSVRASGVVERIARWARRNPRDAGLIGTVAGLLLILAVGGSAAAVFMRQQRDDAEDSARRAGIAEEKETQRAEELRQELIRSNRAIPGEVRAMRLRGQPGQYFKGRARLREALALAGRLGAPAEDVHEIRNEMLNLLTVTDVDVEAAWAEGTAALAYAPELDRYLVGEPGGPVAVHEAPGGRVLARLPADVPPPQWARFGPGGRHLLLGYAAGPRAELWELDGDGARRRWTEAGVSVAAFLGDGSHLAVAGPPGVRVLAAATGVDRRRIPAARWVQEGMPAHPGRPWLVVERGPDLAVVDWDTGTTVAATARPTGICRVAWHPTRPVLAIAADQEIRQWDVIAGRDVLPPLRGHTHGGVYPGYERTGEVLVSSDWSCVVRCWDAVTGRPLFTGPRIFLSVDYTAAPAGRLAVGRQGGRLQLYRFHPGRGLRVTAPGDPAQNGLMAPVRVSPDGRLLAARAGDARCVLLDPATGAELAELPDAWRPIGFQADGALLTVGPRGPFRWPVRYAGGRCRVGPPTRLLQSATRTDWGASADGGVLAEPRFNDGVMLIRLPSGRWAKSADPQRDVRYAVVSPDGRWAIAASHQSGESAAVTVVASDTGQTVARLAADGGRVGVSPDGTSVVVFGLDGGYRVIATDTWTDRWPGSGHAAAFDPAGRLLAVGEGQAVIRLRAAADGREVARLEVPDPTRLVPECFSSDGGRLFATGLDDRQLYVWDLRHLRERLTAEGLDWVWPVLPAATDQPAPDRVEVVPYGRAEQLARDGYAAVRASDAATAADRIAKLRALDPDDPVVAARLSELLTRGPAAVYDPAAAAGYARRAVAGRPDLGLAHVALGIAEFHRGEYRSAAASLAHGMRIDQQEWSVYARYTLARARLLSGDPAGAADAADETIRAWVRQAAATVQAANRPPKKK